MTRRTSPSHSHTLNRIAFRAYIGLPKMEITSFTAPELRVTRFAKELKMPQINANTSQPQHLGSTLTGPASLFPHRSHPAPAASS